MDGCLSCGAQHIGSCNPRHPEHRPLSAEQWAEREATLHTAEKETPMPNSTENESQLHAPGGGRWQTFKAHFGGWFSRREEAAPQQAPAALTPTASYVLPTLPSPAAVARDERVEERIRQIADPQQRAEAAALLETIRSEVTTQQQQRGRAQERDRELER